MKAYDFEYDGLRLSDMGYTICDFSSSSSVQTVSAGAEISFNTVSTMWGKKYELVDMEYKTCLEATFQICKNQCDGDVDLEIPSIEIRRLNQWLNRKQYRKLRILEDDYDGIYFEGSFNISRLDMDGVTIGLELDFTTNRPYALQEPRILNFDLTSDKLSCEFYDVSDEAGDIYPWTEITVTNGGDLEIYSEYEDRTTRVANCSAGEVITMDNPVIQTSDDSHSSTLQNDFNWNFLRISNEFRNKKNKFTASIPCTIKMIYSPVAKIGF